MIGKCLIAKRADPDDKLGKILSVSEDADSLILQGILLAPQTFKNWVFTGATLERSEWKSPVELFDNNEPTRRLIGAGKIERKQEQGRDALWFTMQLLNEEHREALKRSVAHLGLTAFERIYPVMPVFKIDKHERICNICNEPLGLNGCKHEVGRDYLRRTCRVNLLKTEISNLVWSGVRSFVV